MSFPLIVATIMRPSGETGVQTHFAAFLAWLAANEHEAELVTPYTNPRWQVYPLFAVRRLIDPFFKTASVWWYRYWHEIFLARALANKFRDDGPCSIYAQCPLSAGAALRTRRSDRQQVFMVVHFNLSQADEWVGKGMIEQDGNLYKAIQHFEAEVLPRLDGLVFVSEFMRRALLQRIPGAGTVPYRVIPNFLRDPHASKLPATVADLICIGSLEPRKNQDYALQIVAVAKAMGHPMSLTLVGDGPDRPALEVATRLLGIADRVNFAGFVSGAADLMLQHRACLHVARVENLPVTLLEGLSRGLPLFATPVGGVPEVFDDGVEGRLIPLDDAETAARMIIEWLDCPETMAEVGAAARTRFLERFEADKVAASLAGFLLDDRAQP